MRKIIVLLTVMVFLSVSFCHADNSERIVELQTEIQKIRKAIASYQDIIERLNNGFIGNTAIIGELKRQDKIEKETQEKAAKAKAKDEKIIVEYWAKPEGGMMEKKIKDIIIEQLGLRPEEALPGASLEGLGADALDKIELTMALEEEFNIEISDEDAEKLITVKDIVDYVMAKEK